MPNTFIDWVDILGKFQQELSLFTDHKFLIIGENYVELTGVGEDGDENEASLKFKMKIISTVTKIKRRFILSGRTKPLFDNPSN